MDVKLLSTLISKPLNSIYSIIGAQFKQAFSNKILEYSVEEYKRNYYCKTILHRVEPISLDKFYQPLYLRQIGQLERIATTSVKELFSSNNKIAIIGTAGSGKSTMIKHLALNCYSEGNKIPIKIELRYLNEYGESFTSYIMNEVFSFYQLGMSNDIVSRLLYSGNFTFFLDGYDEISYNKKAKVTAEINAFMARYSNNYYLMSSRPFANLETMPLFVNYEVCELQDNEIVEFISKQIPLDNQEVATNIVAAIENPSNSSYKSFLSNPLLLSMFILTFQSYSELPQKKNIFYRQVFETLFSLHDSLSKLSYVRDKASGLNKDQFELILKLFSAATFLKDKFIFSVDEINQNLDIIKTHKSLVFDNQLLLDDLQVAIGILNREGLDYTFPHRSLQEYFASLFITNLNAENKKKFYKDTLENIQYNFDKLFYRVHFYSLLNELDFTSMVVSFCLPILRRLHESIYKSINAIDVTIKQLQDELKEPISDSENAIRKEYEIDRILVTLKSQKDSEITIHSKNILLFLYNILKIKPNFPEIEKLITNVEGIIDESDFPMVIPISHLEGFVYNFIDKYNSIVEIINNKIDSDSSSDLMILSYSN